MPNSIKSSLSAACCSLLSANIVQPADAAAAEQSAEAWDMSLGAANYIERERNTGFALYANGARDIAEDRISIQLELDIITGATPNGATASNVPQTFTMSSGVGSYTTAPGELPADDTHMDMRLGFSLAYEDEISSRLQLNYRGHISMEFDYLSMGAGISGSYDLNRKNTSLLFSYDYEYNRVHPVGNIPIPLASMQPAGQQQPRDVAAATKRVDGYSLGINQLLSPYSLVQLKYASSHASGYLSDPYKLVSIIDDPSGSTLDYIFESRPGGRQMQSIYIASKTWIAGDVLDFSYRYYRDDWEIKSSTLDLRYRLAFEHGKFLQPKFRYYRQSESRFFAHSLPNSRPVPAYVSADFRMAEFDAYTLGLKFGKANTQGQEHSLSIEYYTQIGESSPDDAIGLQKQQDLFPTLQTLVLFYQYGFSW